jgi:hypothetical protein
MSVIVPTPSQRGPKNNMKCVQSYLYQDLYCIKYIEVHNFSRIQYLSLLQYNLCV